VPAEPGQCTDPGAIRDLSQGSGAPGWSGVSPAARSSRRSTRRTATSSARPARLTGRCLVSCVIRVRTPRPPFQQRTGSPVVVDARSPRRALGVGPVTAPRRHGVERLASAAPRAGGPARGRGEVIPPNGRGPDRDNVVDVGGAGHPGQPGATRPQKRIDAGTGALRAWPEGLVSGPQAATGASSPGHRPTRGGLGLRLGVGQQRSGGSSIGPGPQVLGHDDRAVL